MSRGTRRRSGKPEVKAMPEGDSFLGFLRSRDQRWELVAATVLAIGVFLSFRVWYPMPQTTDDTPDYVYSAQKGDFNGYRPVGFPWFLRSTHVLSGSFEVFATMQFALHLFALFFLAFMIKYRFPPRRPWLFRVVLVLLAIDPTLIYATRWVMSDSVNTSFTMIWLATLIGLLHRPRSVLILLVHLCALFLVMKVRYASLVLPLISAIVFWRALGFRRSWHLMVAPLFCVLVVSVQGRDDNQRLFGLKVFSGFSGWAQVNNMTAILPYVRGEQERFKDKDAEILHKHFLQFSDTCYALPKVMNTLVMWRKNYPPKQALRKNIQQYPTKGYVWNWVFTGGRLGRYAQAMILKHPLVFLRRFILPNAANLFLPPREGDTIHYRKLKVDQHSKAWFGFTQETYTCNKDAYGDLIAPVERTKYMVLFGLTLLVSIAWWIRSGGGALTQEQRSVLWVWWIYVPLSMAFLVLAIPVVPRFLIGYSSQFLLILFVLIDRWPPGRMNDVQRRSTGSISESPAQ